MDVKVRILRKMRIRDRQVEAGETLDLEPREAVDVVSTGFAEPVNRDAYAKACQAVTDEALRIVGPVRAWPPRRIA